MGACMNAESSDTKDVDNDITDTNKTQLNTKKVVYADDAKTQQQVNYPYIINN